MSSPPLASIIIVNYNGAHFLPACLDALQSQTVPQDRFEVIVSDNASSDGSIELLRSQYPRVTILENKENLGFAAGNNRAFDIARGKAIILLNNDTAPQSNWLENLLKTADENPKAGIVTGHLHLFYDYITIRLSSDTFSPPGDGRKLGVQVHNMDSGVLQGVYLYLDGLYGWEHDDANRKFRWTNGEAQIGIPVPLHSRSFTVKIKLAAPGSGTDETCCRVYFGDLLLASWTLSGNDPVEYILTIPEEIRAKAVAFEQNAGSIVFYSGMGRDRGTYARNNEAFFEPDLGRYSDTEEVFAGCGASLLLKREMLADVGSFDDDFFMYYEDTDLSWRARLFGWIVLYSPDAIVRHIHCGTTKEWSPSFVYLTERNRLAMILKNGSGKQVLRVWGGFLFSTLRVAWKSVAAILSFKPIWRQYASQLKAQARVLWTLLLWQPKLWRKRHMIQRNRRVSHREIEAWFIQ